MKLIFIRHGEPDYTIDSLTEKGWREAEILSNRMAKTKMDYIYVSPLGRAKDTAKPTLEKTGRSAIELPWLQEFPIWIPKPGGKEGEMKVAWDWLPEDWTRTEYFYDKDNWDQNPVLKEFKAGEEVNMINSNFDNLLKEHGYERDGNMYKAIKANNDTIVFFCHFALTCVLLGHLLGVSPMVMWHGFCAAPTSVTTVATEERRAGKAIFRMLSYGDTSHLYEAGEPISFAARFCECYDNKDERHD